MTRASDIRYGRQGGRIVGPASDVKAYETWQAQRDALAAAAARAAEEAGEQLDLFDV